MGERAAASPLRWHDLDPHLRRGFGLVRPYRRFGRGVHGREQGQEFVRALCRISKNCISSEEGRSFSRTASTACQSCIYFEHVCSILCGLVHMATCESSCSKRM